MLPRVDKLHTCMYMYTVQAASKQLKNGKVVHLRAVIKSIIPAGKNASALIKDPTGEPCPSNLSR